MQAFTRPVRRRLLITLGALTLVDAWAHSANAGGGPRAAAPARPAAASPQPSLPAVPRPTPGVCPPGGGPGPGGPQRQLPCSGTDIALTVDDGPDPRWTPQILALLARYRIVATFSMIGRQAAAHPALVAAVVGGGHQIANHTFTHPMPFSGLSPARIRDELLRTSDAIGAASGGPRPTLFRAPGGAWSPAVLAACAEAGMRPLDWSVDPRDWSSPGVARIVEVILTRTRPGSIILDHDGGGNRQQTVDALAIALPRLLDAGYRFTHP